MEINHFITFIEENKKFFIEYEDKFVKILLELISKTSPNIEIDKIFKLKVKNLYESLFIEPFIKNEKVIDLDFVLFELEYSSILNRFFLIMANSYIKEIINYPKSVEKLLTFTRLCDFYLNYLIEYKEKNVISNKVPHEIVHLFDKKKPIIYLTVFRGVPISYKTYIEEIDTQNQEISLKINSYQLIASKLQNKAYIIDPVSAKAFTAYIKDIDEIEKKVILYNFLSTKRSHIKRNFIRVQPATKIEINMFYNHNLYNGTIYDISLRGVAVIARTIKNAKVSDKFELEIEIAFNGQVVHFTIIAELVSITKLNNFQCKYHFYFKLPPKDEMKLEKYIVYREKEIIKELNEHIKNTLL